MAWEGAKGIVGKIGVAFGIDGFRGVGLMFVGVSALGSIVR